MKAELLGIQAELSGMQLLAKGVTSRHTRGALFRFPGQEFVFRSEWGIARAIQTI